MKFNFLILILLGVFILTLPLIRGVYAETFIDNTQTEFDAGSYSNTVWDVDHVELFDGQTSGTFTSGVFDAGQLADWSWLEWSENLVSADKLIAVDSSADVWKSVDGGITWSLVKDDYNGSDGNNVDDMAIDSSGNIFILSNQDIWKSEDQGMLWEKVNDDYNGEESQNGLRIASDQKNNLYIVEDDEDIWMSEDSGKSWAKQAVDMNEKSGNVDGFVALASSLYIVDGSADVWSSTDNGVTWFLIKDDYNDRDENSASYMSYDPNGNLYIFNNQDIWMSADHGVSWDKINDDYNGGEKQNSVVAVIDSSGNLFIAEEDEDIWMSEDRGASWKKRGENINGKNENIFGMVYVSVSTDIIFSARSGDSNPPTDSFSRIFSDPNGANPGVANGQYFQYQTTFTSEDNSITPELFNTTITYSLLDVIAPSVVSNLSASTPSDSEIFVSWTAPGDDGDSGTAESYDLRYSTANITSDNWDSATQVDGEPTPSPAGSVESKIVSGLLPNTTYYFAIKTSDEVPNESDISNVASVATEKRDIYISADDNTKIYGDSDPELTYTITDGSLLEGDSLSGQLSRDVGENVGSYDVSQGALSGESYNIIFTGADFTISKRLITVAAVADSKVYDGNVSSSKVPVIISGSLADGDTASFIQAFNTPDVDSGKILIPVGSVNDGNGGNNYEVTLVNNETGIITNPPTPSIGGSGGGAPPAPSLIINNESIEAPDVNSNSITLEWTTNLPSSSQVIYSIEGEPHSLDVSDNKGSPPKYGYAHTTPNYDTDKKVRHHSVTISNLSPGINYYFRTISHGSLAISWEYMIKTKSIEPEVQIEQPGESEIAQEESNQPEAVQKDNFLDNSNQATEEAEEVSTGTSSARHAAVVMSEEKEETKESLDKLPPESQNIILASFYSMIKLDNIFAWLLDNVALIIIFTTAFLLSGILGIIIYRKRKNRF